MRYHLPQGERSDEGYCDCGKFVTARIQGFGPQTTFTWVDNDGSETCE